MAEENVRNGILAPNHKPVNLQEVEDDAIYITERRFKDHYEEQEREAAKKERAKTKA